MIFAGTPHKGFELIPFDKKGRILRFLGRVFKVPCVIQMLPGSKFLESLNKEVPIGGTYIFGKKDKVVPEWSSAPSEIKGYAIVVSVDSGHGMFPNKFRDARFSAIPVVVDIAKATALSLKTRDSQ